MEICRYPWNEVLSSTVSKSVSELKLVLGMWHFFFRFWPPSRSALISGSTIKILNCNAALRLFIFLLSGHRPEETRVHWPWDIWCAEPQIGSRYQPIFVSDTVSSDFKYSILCFLSKKPFRLGLFFLHQLNYCIFNFCLDWLILE